MSKSLALVSTAILGLGAPATTTAYHKTKSTIWQELQDYVIPDNEESNSDETLKTVWTTLKSNISSKSESIKDSELKAIAKQEGKTTDENSLKDWCFRKYKEIYWSFFQPEQSDLKNDVMAACFQKISDQITSNKFSFQGTDTNKSAFTTKIATLKNHQENNDAKLDSELKKIKDNANAETNWKELEEWCKNAYDKGYQGKSSNRWKLVNLYCKSE